MATLSVQQITTAGVVPASLVAAGGSGDQFPNNGRTFLDVANDSGGSINVTIASQRLCDQGATHNTVVAVADGATKRLGPFDPSRYNDGTGSVHVSYSDATSVTVGAFSA
jgi:hypothetical protein